MSAQTHADDILRRYLLGRLTPEQRESAEARLFSEDRIFWEHLREAEETLIDDYLWDGLEAEDKEQFERHFMVSAERRGRLEFARALRRYARSQSSEQDHTRYWLHNRVSAPAWMAAAAAALLLIVLPGVAWHYGSVSGSRTEIVAVLSPSTLQLRSAGGNVTRVLAPARCQLIRFQLDPGTNEFDSYRATLKNVEGDEIWSQGTLAASGGTQRKTVGLVVPCELMPEGDYSIALQGLPLHGDAVIVNRYDVRVLREE